MVSTVCSGDTQASAPTRRISCAIGHCGRVRQGSLTAARPRAMNTPSASAPMALASTLAGRHAGHARPGQRSPAQAERATDQHLAHGHGEQRDRGHGHVAAAARDRGEGVDQPDEHRAQEGHVRVRQRLVQRGPRPPAGGTGRRPGPASAPRCTARRRWRSTRRDGQRIGPVHLPGADRAADGREMPPPSRRPTACPAASPSGTPAPCRPARRRRSWPRSASRRWRPSPWPASTPGWARRSAAGSAGWGLQQRVGLHAGSIPSAPTDALSECPAQTPWRQAMGTLHFRRPRLPRRPRLRPAGHGLDAGQPAAGRSGASASPTTTS